MEDDFNKLVLQLVRSVCNADITHIRLQNQIYIKNKGIVMSLQSLLPNTFLQFVS